jgi:hypothetical protein
MKPKKDEDQTFDKSKNFVMDMYRRRIEDKNCDFTKLKDKINAQSLHPTPKPEKQQQVKLVMKNKENFNYEQQEGEISNRSNIS